MYRNRTEHLFPPGGPAFAIEHLAIEPPLDDADTEAYRLGVCHVLVSLAAGAYVALLDSARSECGRVEIERRDGSVLVPVSGYRGRISWENGEITLRLQPNVNDWTFDSFEISLTCGFVVERAGERESCHPARLDSVTALQSLEDVDLTSLEATREGGLRLAGADFKLDVLPDEDGMWHLHGTGGFEWLNLHGSRGQLRITGRTTAHYTGWEPVR